MAADSAPGRVEPSGEVISRVRCRDQNASSATSAPAVSASCATAGPYEPSLTACTAPIADAGGTHRSTSAAGSSSPSPDAPSRCAPKLTICAPMAMTSPLSTARSRPLRLVSSRTLATATARARATHTSSARTTATAPTANAAPPRATATTDPTSRHSVNSGPMPTSEAVSSAPTSGRGRSGSITSRVGSSVSSPLGKNSGITAQPSPITATASTTTDSACACPRSAIRPINWSAAKSRAKTAEVM